MPSLIAAVPSSRSFEPGERYGILLITSQARALVRSRSNRIDDIGSGSRAPMTPEQESVVRKVQVGGASISVTERGTGSPVLMFHGNPDSSIIWEAVAERLAVRFRCIALDLPGFGHSGVPADFEPSLEAMARFVEEFRNAAGIEQPIDVIAHDFGGPFAFAWAVKHADAVRRLVAINTLFFSDYHWHFWGRVWRTPILGELSMALMNRLMFAQELNRGSGRWIKREHVKRTWALVTPRMRKEVLRLYRATDPAVFKGWEDNLLALTARKPTLVIWGDKDPYISSQYAERFGAKEVVHLSRVGHWPPVEAPVECAEIILRFLSEEA
jgi:pimeloyl-ACP methyl ester carboxylesterase